MKADFLQGPHAENKNIKGSFKQMYTFELRILMKDTFILFILFYFFKKNIYLFIYLWLCWVFVSVRGLSLVAAGGGHSSSRCVGLSLSRPLLLRSTGSRRAGSVVVAHGLSCSTACGIFPDQGSNPCPLHWQADSQPLCHQGSPILFFNFYYFFNKFIFLFLFFGCVGSLLLCADFL